MNVVNGDLIVEIAGHIVVMLVFCWMVNAVV
jgi:hypothetical protein